MNRQTKLYNVIFPVWMLVLVPMTWVVVLPANFIIDSAVVLIGLRLLKAESVLRTYKSVILKVWALGFAADIIGCVLLFLSQIGNGEAWYEYIQGPVAYNPLDNIFALLYVLIAVAVSGALIYFFNMRVSLKRTELEHAKKRALSLALAVLTAPYIFLVPLGLIPGSGMSFDSSELFTNHIVSQYKTSLFILRGEDGDRIDYGDAEKEYYLVSYTLREAVNTADKARSGDVPDREPDYTLDFYDSSPDEGAAGSEVVYMWLEEGDRVFFRHSGRFYRARHEDAVEIARLMPGVESGNFPGTLR